MKALEEAYSSAKYENWDGYGAMPVRDGSYNHAKVYWKALPYYVPSPDVDIDPDGEISLEWRVNQNFFSVSVGNIGELSYAGLFDSGNIHGRVEFNDTIPGIILDKLQKLNAEKHI